MMHHRSFLAIIALSLVLSAKGRAFEGTDRPTQRADGSVLTCDTVWGPVIMDTGCEAYVWNGEMYTESGIYKQHFPSLSGCDSVVTLQLTIADIDTTVTQDGATLTVWQDRKSVV